MRENYIVCNCMQVSYSDIADTLLESKRLDDAIAAFEDVQAATKCSTGCGGCYQSVLDVISHILSGAEI